MNKLFFILLSIFSINAFGQKDLTKTATHIEKEGKLLYRSEMASWHGTDLFLGQHQNKLRKKAQ
ncbi:hypothetical protein KMW28_05450 [Flammeovirga yaeyamensis]|uniref:Uncharacterized protein n=1 Tax=Flammeovirga yaeyamensis TaxID=367791 RepID=A0AAX1N6H2_9BACT|nr:MULTISPECIES: hypothetical protein [Flammeovirga]ANQ49488.1 hypothetical protein MY04_2114 [Flammeovirga sp. MY04]MBB3697610.1 hypothetical protein [Flammeovirga yaeyamensis]NMF36300.1 hypothetical protein [Flammeovirga yaeyamensis]QWG03027.1 hypothetical protein KMW28_05450 [Flammeovirga yaeyamensis]